MTIVFVKDCRSQSILIPPVGGGGGDTVIMDAGGITMDDIDIDVSLEQASFVANLPDELSVVIDDISYEASLNISDLVITLDDDDIVTEVCCS